MRTHRMLEGTKGQVMRERLAPISRKLEISIMPIGFSFWTGFATLRAYDLFYDLKILAW